MEKEKTVIGVSDMMCGHCEATVEKALAALGAKAKADKDAKQVSVVYDPTKVTLQQLKDAIAEAGFTVA